MISIYCTRQSRGARDLVNEINKLRGRAERSGLNGQRVSPGAFVVNWGTSNPKANLNRYLVPNKLTELKLLKQDGVRVPAFRTERPGPFPEWLPRTLHHQKGRDFIGEMGFGDFYTKKIDFSSEYRVHVIRGRVIRMGKKTPRTDNHHPWIRSSDFGWKTFYALYEQTGLLEPVALRAIEAVGYDFGAVDMGIDLDGEAFVLEINSAPGLQGGTRTAYAEAFIQAERETRDN